MEELPTCSRGEDFTITWVLAFVVLSHPFRSSVHGLGLTGLGNSNAQWVGEDRQG